MESKDAAYCVLTGFLNPILDGCRFWRSLEWVIFAVLRVRKRDDDEMLALVLAEDPAFLD